MIRHKDCREIGRVLITNCPVFVDFAGDFYIGTTEDKHVVPLFSPSIGETLEEFVASLTEVIENHKKTPEEKLVAAVDAYLTELDETGSASCNDMQKALEAVKAAKK